MTILKQIGLVIAAAEFLLLIIGVMVPTQAFPYVLIAMGVLLLCVLPIAAIDIYQTWPR